MLELCQSATKSIYIEQYIFVVDETGNKFLEIFKKKTAEGVKVRMLLDAVGSYGFYNSALPEELRKLGIEIRFFNSTSPWRVHTIFSWFFRNHKKTLVVDERAGFTGGTGVGVHMKLWRDTTAYLEGSVVQEIMNSFEEMWVIAEEHNIVVRIKELRLKKMSRDFITNSPYFKKRFLYQVIMAALRASQKTIYLTTPYFIPDRRLIRILRLAVHRGVDVRVIVPEIIDVLLVATASHSSFGELLRDGVRIYKYTPATLHAKTIVVDDEWATFGSFNLDSLSFRYNYEANVVTLDSKCVAELKEHFLADLQYSREITYKEWKNRPFLMKFQEFFVRPFRGFL